MGFFKNLNKGLQDAQAAHAQQPGGWAEQKAMADRLNNPAGPPLQDDDPGLAPIEGMTLQRYAEIAVATQHFGTDTVAQTRWAESEGGVPEGRWMAIATQWSNRMMADPRINKRFNELWREANARR